MVKKWILSLSVAALSGCAQFPDLGQAISALYPLHDGHDKQTRQLSGQGHFNFDWALSGDRTIAPLQVFDNGVSTWLQFAVGAPVPAVFARTRSEAGADFVVPPDRLLAPVQQADYVVLNEVPDQLVFRGGHLQAEARRARPVLSGPAQVESGKSDAVVTVPDEALNGSRQLAVVAAEPFQVETPAEVMPSRPVLVRGPEELASAGPVSDGVAVTLTTTDTSASFAHGVSDGIASRFSVDRTDGNLRLVLMRWAGAAGWDFSAEHWGVDVDIPIIGSATFELPFVEAVQALVSSTELSGHPLQPCFYSNRVLRVVPYVQPCNRSAGPQVSA